MNQVLIIDDSRQIRERIVVLLAESAKIMVAGQAGSAKQGWKALQLLHPDTVILDVRLPDGSGIHVLKAIKTRFPQVKVIMLTNFDDDRYRRQCRQLGADHFLSKTREFEKLIDAVLDDAAH